MKKSALILLILALYVPGTTGFRLYSRALEENHVKDSLKSIDSLRVVDSLRIADSCIVARYKNADSVIADEKKNVRINKESALSEKPDTVEKIFSTKVDDIASRSISIAPDNPYSAIIDSLQWRLDSLNNQIHDNDQWFKTMKIYPVSEKKRYMCFLLRNSMKDTTAIAAYCNSLFELYKIKLDMLLAIRNSQDANTKKFISYHIDEHKRKMAELSNFIIVLTPAVPSYPVRSTHKTLIGR